MAMMIGKSYFRFLLGLVRDGEQRQVQPILTRYVKECGLINWRVSKILVTYLCMKNVNLALRLINKLKQNNLCVTFPGETLAVFQKQGRALDAYKLLVGTRDSPPAVSVFDYSVVIDGLCKEGYIDKALELCSSTRKEGIVLNVIGYNSILNGLCRQGCLVEAFRLFDSMERNNVFPSDITYGTLIDALVREGFLLDGRQLFDRMLLKGIKPNTHIYNSLIIGHCKFGDGEAGLHLLNDLESKSLKPDEFTLSAVIEGFCLEGDLERALCFFVEVKRKGLFPDFLGFLYLIRGLYATGRVEEARSILREMLQIESALQLINKVDAEIEPESIESFLVHLCEQGSIREAVIILNEIGSIFYPYKRNSEQKQHFSHKEDSSSSSSMKSMSSVHQISTNAGPMAAKKVKQEGEGCHSSGKGILLQDFDAFYQQMESLCSVGDPQGAGRFAKHMILRSKTL